MKVGDRVIVNGKYHGLEFDNMEGTILAVVCNNVCVEFDEYINGNSYFEGTPGHCWYVRKFMVKKEEIKEESKWGFMMNYCQDNNLCAANPEHWMKSEVAYYNTKNKKENVMEERIEELEKELAALKAQLVQKYEPKPGQHYICAIGEIFKTGITDERVYVKTGRAFDTKEKAEKARNIMVKHDIILKYVIDHAPDYEPTEFECHTVYYEKEENTWYVIAVDFNTEIGTIPMQEWVAEKLADDLNNNRIEGV